MLLKLWTEIHRERTTWKENCFRMSFPNSDTFKLLLRQLTKGSSKMLPSFWRKPMIIRKRKKNLTCPSRILFLPKKANCLVLVLLSLFYIMDEADASEGSHDMYRSPSLDAWGFIIIIMQNRPFHLRKTQCDSIRAISIVPTWIPSLLEMLP
jgi:hypothetical protein